jgi:hypothetical protein
MTLFQELAPQFTSVSGVVNVEELTAEFNARVDADLGQRGLQPKNGLQYKTERYTREYCEKLRKRCIVQQDAGWIRQLRDVRRALRDDTGATWDTSVDMSVPNHGLQIQPEGPQQAAQPKMEPLPETVIGALHNTVLPTRATRAPQTCRLCKGPRKMGPSGDHTKWGYCKNTGLFNPKSECILCKRKRSEGQHRPNGFCEVMQKFVSSGVKIEFVKLEL